MVNSTKPVTLTVALVLAVALVYSSSSTVVVFAVPPDPHSNGANCNISNDGHGNFSQTCCWRERVSGQILGQRYCQVCKESAPGSNKYTDCKPKQPQALEQPPTP